MKVALLFPGQGSQYPGMGKELYENFDIVKQAFHEASETLKLNMCQLCFNGSIEELRKTENSQLAILTISVATYRLYMQELGVPPVIMAGHSLGEYSALVASGYMDFKDVLLILHKRGRFMQEAVPIGLGAMASISNIDITMIEQLCEELSATKEDYVCISNYNSIKQIIVSGYKNTIDKLAARLEKLGAGIVLLNVSAPFHSALMKPAAKQLELELSRYVYGDFKYDVLSNITALPYSSKDNIIKVLANQVTKPVKWSQTMDYLKEKGITLAVELGPKAVLKNLMGHNHPDIEVLSYNSLKEITKTKARFVQLNLNLVPEQNYMELIIQCLSEAVSTKNSNWNTDEYRRGVVEPFKIIQDMQQELVEKQIKATKSHAEDALKMLYSVLITKKIPEEETKKVLEDIIYKSDTDCSFNSLLKFVS